MSLISSNTERRSSSGDNFLNFAAQPSGAPPDFMGVRTAISESTTPAALPDAVRIPYLPPGRTCALAGARATEARLVQRLDATAALSFKCFTLSRESARLLFDGLGRAQIVAPGDRPALLACFAKLVGDHVSVELRWGTRVVYIEPFVCVGTAALLAYQRSLERESLPRAWLERQQLARLRCRSPASLERQLSDFRKQVRSRVPELQPFEGKKGCVRMAIGDVGFRRY